MAAPFEPIRCATDPVVADPTPIDAPAGSIEPALEDDVMPACRPLESGAVEAERWNREWLDYLGREWEWQLTPHSDYPARPPLPASALEMTDHKLGLGWQIALYADADALEGRRVMELGCGCGNLGKLLGRYVASYLGVDYSPLALRVARLVSPASCNYVQAADRQRLAPFFATVETVVGRYFWIHQNHEQGRYNLEFLALFLVPGGRLYADFFWPADDRHRQQFIVRGPAEPMSRRYPSAMFRYDLEDVERLIAGLPFRVQREEVSRRWERRFVVLERLP